MSIEDLDYLIDGSANSIGALLWHLAGIERFFQINTFEGKKWGDRDEEDKLNCSISVLGGREDRDVTKKDMLGWKEHTNSDFDFQLFKGGHLFLLKNRDTLVTNIKERIFSPVIHD